MYCKMHIYTGFHAFQVSDTPWVSELSLTMADKEILLSQTGMLSDKHIDAASLLLSTQFPSIQGLQSSRNCNLDTVFSLCRWLPDQGFKVGEYNVCTMYIYKLWGLPAN